MLKIEIHGLDKLNAELEAMGSSVADTLEMAVKAAGVRIAEQAAENIKPYKTEDFTGELAKATQAPPRVEQTGKYSVEGSVGPQNIAYGRIQEYGGVTGRGHKTRITGKFYMTRAVESLKDECENEMIEIITKGFNR